MQTASLGHERTALRDSIVRANVAVHSKLADSYDLQEPHFRPENRDKVRAILKQLRSRAPGGRLLDLGCGTGFILNLASDLFDELHGIDATPAMLARIGDNTGKIKLHVGIAEQVDFPDNSFDVVTAYSFLHHTLEYADVMREALRVLRPGGLFYVDLEPNQLFWKAISGLKTCEGEYFAPAVEREIDAVLHTDAKLEREHGIAPAQFQLAEYLKAKHGGLSPDEFAATARDLGCAECKVTLQWFLGQAGLLHGHSEAVADLFADHLRTLSPLSNHLFKYFQCIIVK